MKLTNAQEKVLSLLANSPLANKFYWTGGTLLSYHYLHHRKSVDLDFFSEKPFSFNEINAFAQEIKKNIGFEKINYKKIFDRFEFIFENPETLRVEFVYYNHDKKTIHKRNKLQGIYIDSLEDVAANKTLTYFDRVEPKDLFDIYFLLTQEQFTVNTLLELARQKFGLIFTESTFWSEAFKTLPLLHTLKPLIESQNNQSETKLLKIIEEYFKKESAKFLHKNFE